MLAVPAEAATAPAPEVAMAAKITTPQVAATAEPSRAELAARELRGLNLHEVDSIGNDH